jgi:hypothetical protein
MNTRHTPRYRIARFVGRLACAAVAAFAAGWLDAAGYDWTPVVLHLLAGAVGFIAIVDCSAMPIGG